MAKQFFNASLAALEALGPVKKEGKGWRTRCPEPSHTDQKPSFLLYPGGGGRCFSQCDKYWPPKELAELLGQETPGGTGLGVAELAQAKGVPVSFLASLGVANGTIGYGSNRIPCVDIPYFDENGDVVGTRKRLALEGGNRFRWRRDSKPTLYGADRIDAIRKAGRAVLVEGESDPWVMWMHNLPALGIPGTSMWKERYKSLLQGLEVWLWREPGTAADKLLMRVGADLPNVRVMEPPEGVKDPSDLYLQDPENFIERIEQLMAAARPLSQIRAEALTSEAQQLWDSGHSVLEDPSLLHRLVLATEAIGHVDDRLNVAALHIAVVSRSQGSVLSVIVKGPSADGKSHLVQSVLELHPSNAAYVLTAMSERALAYSEEPLAHRHLVLIEAAAMQKGFLAYLVRSLLSEGRIRYETVEKTPDGLRVRMIEKQGPTGLISTTTAVSLDYELETRLLVLVTKENPPHTRKVLKAIAARRIAAKSPALQREITDALTWLALAGDRKVVVLFAERLAELIPVEAVASRVTRDFNNLLAAIESCAFLHQLQRRRDKEGNIIATLADYAMAAEVLGPAMDHAINDAVTESVRSAVNAVTELTVHGTQESASVRQLADHMGIHHSNASRHLRSAAMQGFITNQKADLKGKSAAYVIGAPLPEQRRFLPSVTELALAFPELADGWVDPVTGIGCVCELPLEPPHDRTGDPFETAASPTPNPPDDDRNHDFEVSGAAVRQISAGSAHTTQEPQWEIDL